MSEKVKDKQKQVPTLTQAGDLLLEDMARDLMNREQRRLEQLMEQYRLGLLSRVECVRKMLHLPV